MNTEIIHGQLDVELDVLPLAESGKLVTLEEFLKGFSFQVVEDLIDIRLTNWQIEKRKKLFAFQLKLTSKINKTKIEEKKKTANKLENSCVCS